MLKFILWIKMDKLLQFLNRVLCPFQLLKSRILKCQANTSQ